MFSPRLFTPSTLFPGTNALSFRNTPNIPNGTRGMASLKDLKLRMKSVTAIAKLTKTMQMIASSKMRGALRRAEQSVPHLTWTNKLFAEVNIKLPETGPTMYINITSDKGMCGGVNNQIVRHSRTALRSKKDLPRYLIANLGAKGASIAINEFPQNFVLSTKDFGRKELSFTEVAFVVDQLVAGRELESVTVVYNRFKNAITYIITEVPILGPNLLFENLNEFWQFWFEQDEDATFYDLFEYQLATTIYAGSLQNRASEEGARMTSMDSATKNANGIISLLTLQYNRGRQSAITTELIEITSGANALEEE